MNEKNTEALRQRVLGISQSVRCEPYEFDVLVRGSGEVTIQARLWRQDADTGLWDWGRGGEYLIDEMMRDDVITKRFLVAALSFSEHETREAFLYKGQRIFGPHMPLDALWEVAASEVAV